MKARGMVAAARFPTLFQPEPERRTCETAIVYTWRSGWLHIEGRFSLYGLPAIWLVLGASKPISVWQRSQHFRGPVAAFMAAAKLLRAGRKPLLAQSRGGAES
jgi:hypothetical protein